MFVHVYKVIPLFRMTLVGGKNVLFSKIWKSFVRSVQWHRECRDNQQLSKQFSLCFFHPTIMNFYLWWWWWWWWWYQYFFVSCWCCVRKCCWVCQCLRRDGFPSSVNITTILNRLECSDTHMRVYTKASLPLRHHYTNNRRIDDILLDADDQWIISRFAQFSFVYLVDSFLVRMLDSWSKGCESKSWHYGKSAGRIIFLRVNFVCWLLFCVCSTPVLLQWQVKDLSHSSKRTDGRLHLSSHTPLTQRSQSGLTMPLSGHGEGSYPERSSHTTCQGTFGHSHLSLLNHCGLNLAYRVALMWVS